MRTRPDKYVLNADHSVRPEPDLLTWAYWMETADRQVAVTKFPDGSALSTVFLGIDMNLVGQGQPRLFETMWFAADGSVRQMWRHSTWDDAVLGHQAALISVKSEMGVE